MQQPEHRLPVLVFGLVALGLYLVLPMDPLLTPRWLVPLVGLGVLAPLVVANPRHFTNEAAWARWIGVAFAFVLTLVNQVYLARIVATLVDGGADGRSVLLSTGCVWIINVIAFALVYWELDQGGPISRRRPSLRPRDFRFPQQEATDSRWNPQYVDYLYFSLSNMMTFSPTDTMPLSVRAKALMAYQALTGFVILALVIARGVSILS